MAHKKGVGSSENGRDSKSKRLGVKLFGGQVAKAGSVIIRQRGSKYHLGDNVYFGKDWTLHAKVPGIVKYRKGRKRRTYVSVVPFDEVNETLDVQPKAAPKARTVAPPKVEAETPPVAKVAPMTAEAAEAPQQVMKAAAPAPEAVPPAPAAKDDLKKIEGVGPKIASLLNEAGMLTFADVAATDAAKIKEVLVAAGSRYGFHDPTTWPEQAKMAAEGRWEELKKWQDELDGGKPAAAKAEEE